MNEKMKNSVTYTPSADGTMGLVYRLNLHWAKADNYAITGNYEKWNDVLDTIWRNLSYKNNFIEIKDKQGNIKDIKLSKKDSRIYQILSLKIAKLKNYYSREKNPMKKKRLKSQWYHVLQSKDIWIRNKMQDLKLYLKEYEKNQSNLIYN